MLLGSAHVKAANKHVDEIDPSWSCRGPLQSLVLTDITYRKLPNTPKHFVRAAKLNKCQIMMYFSGSQNRSSDLLKDL